MKRPIVLLSVAAVGLGVALWCLVGYRGAPPGGVAGPPASEAPPAAMSAAALSAGDHAKASGSSPSAAADRTEVAAAPPPPEGPARIEGVVCRREDGRPIAGAKVSLLVFELSDDFERLDASRARPKLTWTDTEGRFRYRLDIDGEHRGSIVVHFVGHRLFQFPLYSLMPGQRVDLGRIELIPDGLDQAPDLLPVPSSPPDQLVREFIDMLRRAKRERDRRGR